MKKQFKVLVVGAHHEEIEAECPNLVAALSLAGCRVTILNPVGGWNWTFVRSLGKGGRERVIADALSAAKALGCEKVIWDYPVAQVDRYQPELIDRMSEFLLELNPEIVLMHWPLDGHADHRAVAHVTRHVLTTAPNISSGSHPKYRNVREVYAFQTGVGQAYHFIPDILVKTDKESMTRADRAVACFNNTSPDFVTAWRKNFHTKADYWGNLIGTPAEALKFLGPELPLDGFLLKKILGDRVVSTPFDRFYYNADFQL